MGTISRFIQNESIKKAKKITLQSIEGNLTFNSKKEVILKGAKGINVLNDNNRPRAVPTNKANIKKYIWEENIGIIILFKNTEYLERYLYLNKSLYIGNRKNYMKLDRVRTDINHLKIILNQLYDNPEGRKLINFFNKGRQVAITFTSLHMTFADRISKTIHITKDRLRIPIILKDKTPTLEKSEPYLILAHELGHLKSELQGIKKTSIWMEDYTIDEIYAIHTENKVRAADGSNLRDRYEPVLDKSSLVIDSDGNSLFIDKNENYPRIDKNGQPIKVDKNNAFNYYE